jgi:hypothetical protein
MAGDLNRLARPGMTPRRDPLASPCPSFGLPGQGNGNALFSGFDAINGSRREGSGMATPGRGTPHDAAKLVAAICPPSLCVDQAHKPAEIFGKVLNCFELF